MEIVIQFWFLKLFGLGIGIVAGAYLFTFLRKKWIQRIRKKDWQDQEIEEVEGI